MSISPIINGRYILSTKDDSWDILHLKNKFEIHALYLFEVLPKGSKVILLPFLFHAFDFKNPCKITANSDQLDKLCKWIQPQLIDETVSFNDIRNKYDELIHYIDNDIMKKYPNWKKARNID